MNGLLIPEKRLKSRNIFLKGTTKLNMTPSKYILEKWEAEVHHDNQWLQPNEKLSSGHENKWPI